MLHAPVSENEKPENAAKAGPAKLPDVQISSGISNQAAPRMRNGARHAPLRPSQVVAPPERSADMAGKQAAEACPLRMTPKRCPFGGACHTCPPKVQAKLTVGQPGDKYEEEADRVAEQVMRMPDPGRDEAPLVSPLDSPSSIRRACADCDDDEIRRQPEDEEKEGDLLRAKAATGGAPVVTPALQARIVSMRGGGQPLPASARAFFEPRFGYDFSSVRIHDDGRAAEAARAVSARAFTVGHDIVFGTGQHTSGAQVGKQLLAHELTHVMQQRSRHVQRSPVNTKRRLYSEDCVRYMTMDGRSACEFYRCREANSGYSLGPRGYYIGYGLKYCRRFSDRLRPTLSSAGQNWLDQTRYCLMEHVHHNVPRDADARTVMRSAFDSHPPCYVRGGICFLPISDLERIVGIIDPADMELAQTLKTGISCIGNWLAPVVGPARAFGAGGGYRGLMERDRRRVFGF
ncbi:MAG: DUF4157 domain-containing protein [Armatimonadota bacterium]|nr:DUF4157 domain-containing protein [Armatimonadota bacterium]